MKQFSFSDIYNNLFKHCVSGKDYYFKGAHPDLLVFLYKKLKRPLCFVIKKSDFDFYIKHITNIAKNDDVMLLPPQSILKQSPSGFQSMYDKYFNLGSTLLSTKLNKTKLILSTPDSLKNCHVEKKAVPEIDLNSGFSFESLHKFLIKNNYIEADIVSLPGQFSLRGAIIDCYPYGFNDPVRISFFEKKPLVCFFDIYSQMSGKQIKSFSLYSKQNLSKKISIKKTESFKRFLILYDHCENSAFECVDSKVKLFSYSDFLLLPFAKKTKFVASSNLSSIALYYNNKSGFAPYWFLNIRVPLTSAVIVLSFMMFFYID